VTIQAKPGPPPPRPGRELWPVVCLTGPRPQHISPQATRWLTDQLGAACLWLKRECGTTAIVSGMAIGADQIWAQAGLDAGLDLWAFIPFPQQPDVWRDRADRDRWAKLRAAATREKVFADRFSLDAYGERNRGMLDVSQALFSCWQPRRRKGGTYDATVEAVRRGMPGRWLDPSRMVVYLRLPTLAELQPQP
jgi:hypothetical protein